MMRPTIWLPVIASALLVGCQQGPGVGVDPFGRTTIPPPPTGTASLSNAVDPYYSNVPSAAPALVPLRRGPTSVSSAPSFSPATSSTFSQGGTGWVPTGQVSSTDSSHRLQPMPENLVGGTRSERTQSTIAETTSPARVATASFQQPAANPQPASRRTNTLGLRWKGGRPAAAGEVRTSPRSASVPQIPSIDLASLPAARPATQGNPGNSFSAGTPVISRREPTRGTYVGNAQAARYGHAEDYTWLRGRLEYHASQRQWKLRYIPIDGQTDDYGGSVALSATAALEDFQAGDYVMVNGRLADQDADARDFAATYIASRISVVD